MKFDKYKFKTKTYFIIIKFIFLIKNQIWIFNLKKNYKNHKFIKI